MARSTEEIYNAIIEEKINRPSLDGLLPADDDSDNLLDDLSSDSKVAIWRLWAWITAAIINTHEVLWDLYREDVDLIIANAAVGTPAWYKQQVLNYQHSDDLVYQDLKYQYLTLDKSKRIVKSVAINERGNGSLFIKVAKAGGNGLVELSAEEKDGLESYVNKIKFAGSKTAVSSNNADSLNIVYDIYYDPIVPLSDIIDDLTTAELAYRQNLEFDGAVNINKFTDMLQNVRGVKDPIFKSASLTTAITLVESTFTIERIPGAGYYELSDTLDNLFNFIAKP